MQYIYNYFKDWNLFEIFSTSMNYFKILEITKLSLFSITIKTD
ncbi:unknown [Firmicutes bacterium CAG:582]|nr:unknown [Firmicutes bacterium CAG:582]